MALTTTGRATQAFPLHPPADLSHFFPAVAGASDSTALVPHAGFALVPVTNGQRGEMVVVRPEQLYVAQIEGSVKSRDKDGNVTVLLTAASMRGGKRAEVCSVELQFLSLFDQCKAILEEVVSLLFGQQLPENIQDIVEEILYYAILPPIAEGISIFRETRLKHRLSENDYEALCHMRANLTPLREVRDERQAANKSLLPSQTWVEASSFWGEHEHFAGGGRTLVELTVSLSRPGEQTQRQEIKVLLTNVCRVYASSVMMIVRLLLEPRAAVTYRMSDLVRNKFKASPVIAYRKKDQNLTLEERVARAAKTIRDRILSFLAFSTVRHEAIALFKQMPREGQLKYANDFAFLCHLKQNNGVLLAAAQAAETEKALALPRAGKAYAYGDRSLEVRALEAGRLAILDYRGWDSLRPVYARALEDSLRAEHIPAVVRNKQLVLSFLAAYPKREVLTLFRRARALLWEGVPQRRTESDAAVITLLKGPHRHLVQKSCDEVRRAIMEANPYRVLPLRIDLHWSRHYDYERVSVRTERSNAFHCDTASLDFNLLNTFSSVQEMQEEARAVLNRARAAAGLQEADDFTATEQLSGGKKSCLEAAVRASDEARREKGAERPFHVDVQHGFGNERQLTVTLSAQSGKVKGSISYTANLDRSGDSRNTWFHNEGRSRLDGEARALYAQAKKEAGFEALSDAEALRRLGSDRSSIFWTLVEAANQAKLNQPVPHIPVVVLSKVPKENGVVSVELRSNSGGYYTSERIEIVDFRELYERAKQHLAVGNIPQAVFEAIASFNERSLNEEALFLFDRAKEADPRMARMTNYDALHLFRSDWKALQATFTKSQAAKKALLTQEQLAAILADVPQARDYDYGAVIDFHRQLTRTLKAQEALRLAAPAPLLLKGPVNGPVAPVNREEVQARVSQRFEEGGVAVELSASRADSWDSRPLRQSIELTDLFEGYMGALKAAFTGVTQEAKPAPKITYLMLSEIAALITGYLESPPSAVALQVFAVAKMEAGLAAKTDREALTYFERHVDVLKRVAGEFEAIKWSDIAPETHMLAEAGPRQGNGQVRVQFTLKLLERGELVRKKTNITIDIVDLFSLIQGAFPAALATAPERVMRTACSYLDVTAVPAGEEALSIFRVAKVAARLTHLHDFAALRFLSQNPRHFAEEVAERRESALWFVGREKASDDSAEEVSTEAIQREELARLETRVADPYLPFGTYARAWEKIDNLRSTLKVPNQKLPGVTAPEGPGVTVPEAMPLTEEARQLEIVRLEALAKDSTTPNVEAIRALKKLGRILWPLSLEAERALTQRIRELQAGVSEALVPTSRTSAKGGAAHMIAALSQPLSRIVPASGN